MLLKLCLICQEIHQSLHRLTTVMIILLDRFAFWLYLIYSYLCIFNMKLLMSKLFLLQGL